MQLVQLSEKVAFERPFKMVLIYPKFESFHLLSIEKLLNGRPFMCRRRKFFTLLRDGRWENKNRTFHWYPACCTCQCPASYLQQISKFRDKTVVRLQPVSGICVCGCFPFLCMCVITLPRPIRTFSPAIFPARLETGVVFGFQFCFSVIHCKSCSPGSF